MTSLRRAEPHLTVRRAPRREKTPPGAMICWPLHLVGNESLSARHFSFKQGSIERCHGVARRAKPDSTHPLDSLSSRDRLSPLPGSALLAWPSCSRA